MTMRRRPAGPTNAADTTAQAIAVPGHTMLQPDDDEAFFAALDTPPSPTERLRAAFARHCGTTPRR